MNLSSKYKVLGLAVIVAALASCSKSFLDLTPPTSVSPGTALSTEADLLVATRGMYAGLRTGITIGTTSYAPDAFGRTIPVIGDVMADNAYQSSTNTNRYTAYNNYTFVVTDGNALGFWGSLYAVILRANNIINSPLDTNAKVNQYKGEAYATRALCYFTLVRYFARPYTDDPNKPGVPIITTYDPDLKPARSTIAEVYALIKSDLDRAFTLMTVTKPANSSEFSKYAARALQAKVFLTMGDMPNAKTAALDVINNSGFKVIGEADYVAYWANNAFREDKLETLFEVSSDAVSNLAFDALSYLYSQAGNYGDFLVSSDLYSLISPTDVRKKLYPTGQRGGPAVFINKYTGLSGDRSDTKILRMSEMYLIAAEASLPGNEADALKYVNEITSRRGAGAYFSSGALLLEDIINERRKELAFEGDRYLDLQRLKRDVYRSTNFPAAADTIPFANFRRLLPIPQAEVDANPNIRTQQNNGY
jgi:hypothetical protein